MGRTIVSGLTAVAAGVLVSVVVPAPAQAATRTTGAGPVACGATVTEDAYLAADLTCPTGDGVTLGRGVTLDLRGHTLTGGGHGVGVRTAGTGTSTVRNGVLEGWDSAVMTADEVEAGARVRVHSLTLRNNGAGMTVVSSAAEVRSSHLVSNDSGIAGLHANLTVRGSRMRGNDVGVSVGTSTVKMTGSLLRDNRIGVGCSESRCTLTRVTIVGGDRGVSSFLGSLAVRDSVFRGVGTGVDSSQAPGGSGTYADVVTGSRFIGNGIGVSAGFLTHLAVRDSTFTRNDVGVAVPASDPPSDLPATVELTGNRFARNGDGVYAERAGVRVGDNAALRNTRWGIYAPGAVDLGGNQARGNGESQQCTGVGC